jgi:hypothetical protein
VGVTPTLHLDPRRYVPVRIDPEDSTTWPYHQLATCIYCNRPVTGSGPCLSCALLRDYFSDPTGKQVPEILKERVSG